MLALLNKLCLQYFWQQYLHVYTFQALYVNYYNTSVSNGGGCQLHVAQYYITNFLCSLIA